MQRVTKSGALQVAGAVLLDLVNLITDNSCGAKSAICLHAKE